MTKRDLVELMARLLPENMFTAIRRRHALCRFNYHSAIKVRRSASGGFGVGLFATCKHCGQLVERDRARQWRAFPAGLFIEDAPKVSFEARATADTAPAIPLVAEETASYLLADHQPESAET
ncbi:MAG: hypothetical protein ACOVQ0_11425 [Novosphingobium sp.]|uniref:hypothetical protein n=1 Tax=Novosphingobium sp. TaxID=1874826 RepID=UPI003B9C195B